MATITKRKTGQWQSKIRRKGYSTVTKTFSTKVEAQAWSRELESDMDKSCFISNKTAESTYVNEILIRYFEEEVPKKKSFSDYKSRINLLKKTMGHLTVVA